MPRLPLLALVALAFLPARLTAQVVVQVQQAKPAVIRQIQVQVVPIGAPPAAPPAKQEEAKAEPYDPVKADIQLLKDANLLDDGPQLLDYLRKRVPDTAEMIKAAQLVRDLGSDSFETRVAASDELSKYGVSVVSLVRRAEDDGDAEVARRATDILKAIEKVPTRAVTVAALHRIAALKPAGTVDALALFLPMADDSYVIDEVATTMTAVATVDGKANPALVKLYEGTDKALRGLAAEALTRGGPEEFRAKLRDSLATEKDPLVRFRVAYYLVYAARQKGAMPEMIRAMGEVPREVAWRAEDLLCRLAGDKAPTVAVGDDEGNNRKAVGAWLAWWDGEKDKIDLAKLDKDDLLLGHTVVVEINIQGRGGRILELGPDKKVRSKVDDLMYPIDAAFLPGGRVLVAEHNGNRVTERDLATGKIAWTHQMNQPLSVQRLPNGNLFCASRDKVTEFTADHKELYSFGRQYDIVYARKNRAGDIHLLTQQGLFAKVDKTGKVLQSTQVGRPNYIGMFDLSPDGKRVLITTQQGVQEFDVESGKASPDLKIPVRMPVSVQRLPNGNILTASQNERKVVEYEAGGKVAWEYDEKEQLYMVWRAFRR